MKGRLDHNERIDADNGGLMVQRFQGTGLEWRTTEMVAQDSEQTIWDWKCRRSSKRL